MTIQQRNGDGKPFHAAETARWNAVREQQHGRGHREDAQR
jgi:hypothetical protein